MAGEVVIPNKESGNETLEPARQLASFWCERASAG